MSAQTNGIKKAPLLREGSKNVRAKQQSVDIMKALNISADKITTA